MLSYVFGFLAFMLVGYNPLIQFLQGLSSPRTPQIVRTPRPQLKEDLLALEDRNHSNICSQDPQYSVHIFSREPLVIYVENFLTLEERVHLLEISNPIFKPSTVTDDGGASTHRDAAVRDSEVAVIPRTDMVRCIEDRARALQGWRDEVWVERLRVQRYGPSGHYDHHFDWSSSYGGWGRVSSFMVWVDDGEGQLRGGGTEFPLLKTREDSRWCSFVECGEQRVNSDATASEDAEAGKSSGVVFKPVPGNAVYWENFRADRSGRGYEETWHAGLPVISGTKVGLNIWSWGRID
ncbi:2OG-Fe(II) oxygenase family oxidoreductase [Cercophora newfieldiana]|uniref:2OG-Fe(II) oxygenase family oxidoreductase n=1 Tax=Cercophora newfieldiana TaxID=92897 RepID=A0AA40CP68_9PEZI|nr:2OG-Fe(II) oxygenase family oxidoreductase [Cercophora newfieldiana]